LSPALNASAEVVKYIGLDMVSGPNVDIVSHPKDQFPFPEESIDAIVTSSAFEHDSRFWMTFLKMAKVLKPGGFMQMNMPYEWVEHRFPVDCWRFYSDSGI
jgi:predicted SAM-dependent methyltransferase